MTRRDKPYRGCTFDPWPCCRSEAEGYGGRPKNEVVCAECRLLISLGKAAKAKADEDRNAGVRLPYWFVERAYAYPYIDAPHRYGKEGRDRLQQAFYDLVWSVGGSADGQPRHSPKRVQPKPRYGDEFEPWPNAIDNESAKKHSGTHDGDWRKLVMLSPAVRDRINVLDAAVRDAIAEAFQTGKEEGASILFGLASGQKSLDEFDLALLTPEERERRRRR